MEDIVEIIRPKQFLKMSDKELERYVRTNQQSTWHYSGTCKMGDKNDKMSVCLPDGMVKGVSGLRISDASLMPVVVAANTNATTIMMGQKIGTIAAQKYRLELTSPLCAKL